ncbi:MAG: L,D-transpeptidase family protein [Ferruginibacter sp.]
MRFYKLFAAIVVILFFITSCQDSKKENKVTKPVKIAVDTAIKGIFTAESGIKFDSTEISKFLNAYPQFKEFSKDFFDFYRQRKFSYAWFDKSGMIEQTNVLWNGLEELNSKGQPINIPYKEKLDTLLHPAELSDKTPVIVKANPEMELMLTAQYFNYAKNIWGGWSDAQTDKIEWYLPTKKLPYSNLLEQLLSGRSVEDLEKTAFHRQYLGMRDALKQYTELEKKETAIKIPLLSKPAVAKPGDSAVSIKLIKTKLSFWGLLSDTSGGKIYTTGMIAAVNRFKKTHNLKPDSIITNTMIEELNVPVKKRIEQIMVNMERFSWVPPTFKADEFIVVNIPEFVLHYFENSKEVWSCNVVVGKPLTKTVVFSGNMKYVVMSPYWNVPPSIIKSEIKPGMARNPNYLAKHNMEWNGGNVRQKPGPSNSLGLVKFLFPNSNNIYLHDSPAKSLFGQNERAFSHGCVRVAKPRDLAIRVLKQDSTWTPEKIDAAMHAGVEKTVVLKKEIPVYIGYFTAFFDKDGDLVFCKDVYDRDSRLLSMITK